MCLEPAWLLADNVDTDQMLHSAAYDLCLQCLVKALCLIINLYHPMG